MCWAAYGVTAAQEEEQSSANLRVGGLTPGFPGLHVQDAEPHITYGGVHLCELEYVLYECVSGWVNVAWNAL